MSNEDVKRPMTEAQHEYLKLLTEEAGESFDERMDESAARQRIEELRAITGACTSATLTHRSRPPNRVP